MQTGATRQGGGGERVSQIKKKRRRARGSPTASNSIPVVRERAINRVEIEEKGRLASRAHLLCITLLLTQRKKKDKGERERKVERERERDGRKRSTKAR